MTIFANKASGGVETSYTSSSHYLMQNWGKSKLTERLYSESEIRNLIKTKADKYHIDSERFLQLAICESGLKPNVKNPTSTASGIFQYIDSTFLSTSQRYGIFGSKNDPYIQAELAARMISEGGAFHWVCKF